MTHREPPIFDAVIRIDRLPAGGRSIAVDADEDERQSIAERMKITAVETFVANLTVTPFRGGMRAQGSLSARIVQPSVLSFEPVSQAITEAIDRIFLPGPKQGTKPAPGAEVFVDLEDDDFPDHIDGAEVDLSELLLETLALAIDPYPRAEGETIDSLGVKLNEPETGPFAGLARLKTKDSDS